MVIGAASNSTKFGRCMEASKLHANYVKEVHARKASNLQKFYEEKHGVSAKCQDMPRHTKICQVSQSSCCSLLRLFMHQYNTLVIGFFGSTPMTEACL